MSFPEPTADADPLALFAAWYEGALTPEGTDRDMMALATANPGGRPSLRTVLFRGLVDGRLRFYTHYQSRKGRELTANPHAALLFHWRSVKRQVRLEGTVERLSGDVSDEYFASRPRASRLSAVVSPQSEAIAHRDQLVRARDALDRELGDAPVPRPKAWGGFGLRPESLELWLDDPERLHHRWRYVASDHGWTFTTLAP